MSIRSRGPYPRTPHIHSSCARTGSSGGCAACAGIGRALAKIEEAAGDHVGTPVAVVRPGNLPGSVDRLEQFRGAVERRRALRLTYYSATRDETSERVVDPMRVLVVGGHSYLEAWCRRAQAVRLFRVDRIDASTELDEPAA